MKNLVDLSHAIEHGMVTYEGLPAPVVRDFLSRAVSETHYEKGTTFQIAGIEMVGNTGTYIDSPFHRYADGDDLSELPLDRVAHLRGAVFRADPAGRAIGPELFAGTDVNGKAVLVHTGWARHWRTDRYFDGHPFLTAEAADWLKAAGAALVGIDSLNIDDDVPGGPRPVHSTLLGAGIPIVEHMCNMENLPESGFTFHAVPVKIKNFTSFPVRAYAIVDT